MLSVDQPYANHNGGHLVFGPDGMLWIGLGDGGSGNDPENRAQDLGTLLGKMLRIDPTPSAGRPYTIPPDNPFVGPGRRPGRDLVLRPAQPVALHVRPGHRRPVDRRRRPERGGGGRLRPRLGGRGENYGWPALEGTRANNGHRPAGGGRPRSSTTARPTGGCSVDRRPRLPGRPDPRPHRRLRLRRLLRGQLLALRQTDGQVTEEIDLGLNVDGLASFGQDGSGELYALSLGGTVYRIDPAYGFAKGPRRGGGERGGLGGRTTSW